MGFTYQYCGNASVKPVVMVICNRFLIAAVIATANQRNSIM